VGAGTMGSGITLAGALSNFNVILCDINAAVLESAKETIEKNLQFLLSKQKISSGDYIANLSRISFTSELNNCKADLIIEAIIEKADIKEKLFLQLAAINKPDVVFASNTSSISISLLQKNIPYPERIAGMHFFNPAHIMKLVELVKGDQTADNVVQTLMDVCRQMGKTAVICKDAPGFIVNRVARHYYLQAMELVQNKVATIEDVDAAMEAAGFKMGPFKLMDLIGMDINLAVSESLYEAFNNAERFKPSAIQIDKVKKGELGRKAGKGFYTYSTQN
jgi:3-hydroxybutyryl-CoA dehydrogenase